MSTFKKREKLKVFSGSDCMKFCSGGYKINLTQMSNATIFFIVAC